MGYSPSHTSLVVSAEALSAAAFGLVEPSLESLCVNPMLLATFQRGNVPSSDLQRLTQKVQKRLRT